MHNWHISVIPYHNPKARAKAAQSSSSCSNNGSQQTLTSWLQKKGQQEQSSPDQVLPGTTNLTLTLTLSISRSSIHSDIERH